MNNLVILEGIILYLNWRLQEQFLHFKMISLKLWILSNFKNIKYFISLPGPGSGDKQLIIGEIQVD